MGIITLTTDFGASPGVLKGVIWGIAPDVNIADLSHTIEPQNVVQAALRLHRQVDYFPDNTIHVVVVDPGVGTARRPIAAQIGPQRFVGPDNGVVTPMLERAERQSWPVRVVHTNQPAYWLPVVSDIFHGRDIFAPVAAHWAAGIEQTSLGEVIDDPVRISLPRPQRTEQGIVGEVTLLLKRFGNIITSIHRNDLAGVDVGSAQVRIAGVDMQGISRTFGEREPGTLISLFGSSGYLMIAVVNGSALERLAVEVGAPVEVRYR